MTEVKIRVPPSAAREGVLRVWLQRVPESSDTIFAVRPGAGGTAPEEVGRAYVYGRGQGSAASEKIMLHFRLPAPDSPGAVRAGEELALLVQRFDGSREPADHLDIVSVE